MGLHDALTPDMVWVWRFYNAYVERAGRAHLLKVPLVKREVINAPSWYYTERERDRFIERERALGDAYTFPSLIYESSSILRYCNQTQRAESWTLMPYWNGWSQWDNPQRGVCNTCLNFVQSANRATLDGPSGGRQLTSRRRIDAETDMKEWITFEQGFRG